jgi:hypothetical protein
VVGGVRNKMWYGGVLHVLACGRTTLDALTVKYKTLTRLFHDNKSTISIAHNLVQHDNKAY